MVTVTIKKGYKQTESGVIPIDWRVSRIGDVLKVRHGKSQKNIEDANGIYPILATGGEIGRTNNFLSNKPSVMIGRKGTIDKPKYIDTPFWTVDTLFYTDIFNNTTPKYIYYKFSTIDWYLYNEASGVPSLNAKTIENIIIVIPDDINEQVAIATILSNTDVLIDHLDKLIIKKKAIKQGTMQQLLTGKKRIPGFSGEWEERKLGAVCDHIRSGIYGAEKEDINLVSFKVATTAHITDTDTWNKKVMEERFFSRNQIDQYSPKTGDLVVVKSSGIAERIKSGKLGFVTEKMSGKFIFSNFLLLLRPKIIDPLFLYYYLTSYPVKSILPNLCEASTYPNLRINEYLNINVPFPTEKEQTTISTILSNMDKEIEHLEQKRDKYIMVKNGMMQQLLTGTIRIYGNK